MLNVLIVIRRCLLRLVISTTKYEKESAVFNSEPVYGDNYKYIKTKIKLYGDNINTNFQGKKIPKENASYKCL